MDKGLVNEFAGAKVRKTNWK